MAVKAQKSINWGGVIKNVAIVTAVLAVGVVAFYAAGAAAGWAAPALGNATAASWIHGIGEALWAGFGKLAYGASYAYYQVGSWLASAATALGFTNTAAVSAATLKTSGGLIGGALAVGAALPIAKQAMDATSLVTTTPVDTGHHAMGMGGMHQAMDTAQHAAAHHGTERHARWTDRCRKQTQTDYGQFARSQVQPRSSNFAEQLNADRANLDAALGTAPRK